MQGAEDPAQSNPLVVAILTGAAPRPLRISAARGVLPLMRAELLRILITLQGDGDDQVRREAAARLSSFTESETLPLLEDPTAPPDVLDHFGCDPSAPASLKAAVIANPATSIETLRRMAASMGKEPIDQLLMNQTRLISDPDLLDLLDANPALTPLQRTRVAEIRLHFLGVGATRPARDEIAPPMPADTAPGATETSPADHATPAEPAEGESETAALIANATQKIMRMDTAQRIQLAIKGNREERTILIKDSNKSVQEAVMQSPKLTENEVEAFARMRSITEEVLRIIAANRDWVKSYAIVHALATNPKTPPGIAMNMVSRLTSRDLRILTGDRNVPELIRRHARKIAETRNQRPGSH